MQPDWVLTTSWVSKLTWNVNQKNGSFTVNTRAGMGIIARRFTHYSIKFFKSLNQISLRWHCFRWVAFQWGLLSVAIRMHPSECSSTGRGKLNLLTATDTAKYDTGEACSSYQAPQFFISGTSLFVFFVVQSDTAGLCKLKYVVPMKHRRVGWQTLLYLMPPRLSKLVVTNFKVNRAQSFLSRW
jgi:hypothetical protein